MTREQAKDIIRRLRINGGPLATEAAEALSWALKQFQQKPRGQIHPHHKALVLLFQERLNKPQRDAKETRAFEAIKHLVDEADLEALRRYFRPPDPKAFHKLLSARKKTPITLMRDYVNQTDLARQWCLKNPPSPDPSVTPWPEPTDWQTRAPGNLGNRSWTVICKQYPDIAEQLQDPCTDLSAPIKFD